MTRRKGLPWLILTIFFCAVSRLLSSDLEQLARELADRIVALPNLASSVALTTRESPAAASSELRELRRLVADELRMRRVNLSPGSTSGLTITLGFSDSVRGRLVIAEIGTGEEPSAIILPVPGDLSTAAAPVRRVSLQKSLVWRQDEPILDFVARPGQILVLSVTRVSLIQKEGQGWKEQWSWDLAGVGRPVRDPRGRLLLSGSEFRAFLPRHECRAAAEPGSRLTCEPSELGWPVAPVDPSDTRVRLASGRNYFDQLRNTKIGLHDVPPFYAAAVLNGRDGPRVAVVTVEGETRIYDSQSPEITRLRGWGPNVAAVDISDCGSWIVVVTESEAGKEVLQAFQLTDDPPVARSERVELDSVVTALWADEGNRVRLVTRDLKSGKYEAWSVALACAD